MWYTICCIAYAISYSLNVLYFITATSISAAHGAGIKAEHINNAGINMAHIAHQRQHQPAYALPARRNVSAGAASTRVRNIVTVTTLARADVDRLPFLLR